MLMLRKPDQELKNRKMSTRLIGTVRKPLSRYFDSSREQSKEGCIVMTSGASSIDYMKRRTMPKVKF